jgi:hypothetical protein
MSHFAALSASSQSTRFLRKPLASAVVSCQHVAVNAGRALDKPRGPISARMDPAYVGALKFWGVTGDDLTVHVSASRCCSASNALVIEYTRKNVRRSAERGYGDYSQSQETNDDHNSVPPELCAELPIRYGEWGNV